jgi:hypothetical protein
MKKIFVLLLAFVLISVVWEFSHAGLYDWDKPPLKDELEFKINRLLKSIVGDFIILTGIFLIISLIQKDFHWFVNPKLRYIVLASVLAFASSIFFEVRGLSEPRWAYNQYMPTIFGLGISPLIQLAVTFLLSIQVTRFLRDEDS